MEIKKVSIDLLQNWAKNPRDIKQSDLNRLKKQITKLGIYKPLLVYPEDGKYTVLIACEKTGRVCRMMEIDPVYISVILDRWAKFTRLDPMREDGKKWSIIKNEKG